MAQLCVDVGVGEQVRLAYQAPVLILTIPLRFSELTFYYSKGDSPLKRVVGPVFNDNSGGGQFHVGMLKLPTGPLSIDVLHQGFQESHLNEGLIYGGVFIEDSADSCVTVGI